MKFTTIEQAQDFYTAFLKKAEKQGDTQLRLAMRELAQRDLFFLIYRILNRRDICHPWLFARCKEVQENPNGYLDLWAREHYKTTIITFGLTIQDILNDPDITFGIFAFSRPAAKGFLRQIKWEMEANQVLKDLFPEIFFQDPHKQSPKWSEDDGLVVKRQTNPKESTIEAWGLIDAMPTAKHFKIRLYDDIITERQVTNPEMIRKVTQAWELSLNLGSQQICKRYKQGNIERYAGTRYHFNDPYREIIARGVAKPRIYPGTDTGKVDGKSIFWPQEILEKKRRDMGPYVFGCQILQDPKADQAQGFKAEWIKNWRPEKWEGMNRYLLCDPAGEKKKENDYTVILVIGLGEDQNYYLIDGFRDRLNLTERTNKLFEFHRTYRPVATGYEKYGKDSDIEHIQYIQGKENYRFHVTELGGPMPKNDRIRKLIPIFEQGRFYIPDHLHFVDYQKAQRDLISEFVEEEFLAFPVGMHDDILDCMARIVHEELHAAFPGRKALKLDVGMGLRGGKSGQAGGWML